MANYALAIAIASSPVQSIAFGSISGTYAGIGNALTQPARLVLLQNLTDADVMISDDGINDKFPLPAKSGLVFDFAANQVYNQGGFVPLGTRYYVKTIGSPGSGSVYLTYFYGNNGI